VGQAVGCHWWGPTAADVTVIRAVVARPALAPLLRRTARDHWALAYHAPLARNPPVSDARDHGTGYPPGGSGGSMDGDGDLHLRPVHAGSSLIKGGTGLELVWPDPGLELQPQGRDGTRIVEQLHHL
jgi:hypothetical protein